MSALATLLGRELRRRLPIHIACLGSGLFVLAIPWLPGVSTEHPGILRGVGAVSVAALWAIVLALLDGMQCLAADLRERRLAFDFRLPVPGTTIWGAKLGAALLTLAAAIGFNLAIPALGGAEIAGGLSGLQQMVFGYAGIELPHPFLATASALLAFLLIANAAALAFASRSAWAALDLSVLIGFGLGAGVATAVLWRIGATSTASLVLELSVFGVALALLVASWFQLSRGRTEPDRAHGALSPALAAIALGAILTLSGWCLWFLSPNPRDLEEKSARATTLTPDVVWLAGTMPAPRKYDFAFLFDPATGKYVRLGLPALGPMDAVAHVSADGSTVAWIEFERGGNELWRQRLRYRTRPFVDGRTLESPISWSMRHHTAWALSPDGSRVASYGFVMRDGREHLVVEDLRSGSIAESLAIPACADTRRSLHFLSQTRVLVSCGCASPGDDTPSAHALDVDLASKSWEFPMEGSACGSPSDRRRPSQPGRFFEPSPHGPGDPPRAAGRMVRQDAPPIELEYPADLPDGRSPDAARFLADGRLATTWSSDRGTVVVLFDPSGKIARELRLSVFAREPLAEVGSHDLILFSPRVGSPRHPELGGPLLRLNLQSGEIRELAADLEPRRPDSATTPTTVYAERDGRLLWLNLETGALAPLLPNG